LTIMIIWFIELVR